MRHTPFAGLTVVEDGDSIFVDGNAFLTRNIDVIDHLLRVGAKTHRHDDHAALPTPTNAMLGMVLEPTGGSLPPSTEIFYTYTQIDADGGETLPAPVLSVTTAAGGDIPAALTSADVDYTAGTLPANVYTYVVTKLDAGGNESPASDPITAIVEPGNANARVILHGLPVSDVYGYRVYRSTNGGPYGLLKQDAVDPLTDDGTPCVDPTLAPPNDAAPTGTSRLSLVVGPDWLDPAAVSYRLYVSTSADFPSPSLFGEFPAADAATLHYLTNLGLQSGAPPVVSTSIGGAGKIGLDEVDFALHWKDPVADGATLGALTGNADGDVRVTLSDYRIYVFHAGAWHGATTGGGGGGGGSAGGPLAEASGPDPIFAGVEWTDQDGNLAIRLTGVQWTWNADQMGYQDFSTGDGSGIYVPGDPWEEFQPDPVGTPDWWVLAPAVSGAGDGVDSFAVMTAGNPGVPFPTAPTFNAIDAELYVNLNFNDDDWNQLGVGFGETTSGNFDGIYGIIDRDAGVIALRSHLAGVWADLATWPFTVDMPAPVAGDTWELYLRRIGTDFYLEVINDTLGIDYGTVDVGTGELPQSPNGYYYAVTAPLPAGVDFGPMRAGSAPYQTIFGHWPAAGSHPRPPAPSIVVNYTSSSKIYEERSLLVQMWDRYAIDPASPSRQVTLVDNKGIVGPVAGSEIGLFGTNVTAGWAYTSYAFVHREPDGAVNASGVLKKSTGAAPVAGDVIAKLPNQDPATGAFTFDPLSGGDRRIPVVTGDDDGEELGWLIVRGSTTSTETDHAPQLVWGGGRSTDPATKHPYVDLSGLSYLSLGSS